ncbi:MAG: type I citrate synthase [Deltaproteobacteria bacterium HGW-Deltaproteobacteria-14]|jgi:citrate synthase|nr:MAG: type I citrate synthase [Deltaproteobacteria bacterium HGW-Deltaproteobacteria-14]
MKLKETLAAKIEAARPRTTRLLKEFGGAKIGEVTVAQAIGGARGVKCLVTDISYLDPMEGIRFRGHTIPETLKHLPKPKGKAFPFVEGHLHLLLTGDFPTAGQVDELVDEMHARRKVPQYVFDVLRAMPRDSHPMTMFSTAILTMQRDSEFKTAYEKGLDKLTAWEPMYEDVLTIMARLPVIAAYIYRMKYKSDTHIAASETLDLGGNFAHMMGVKSPYDELMRLYFILHSDHESGNASAHTTHLVGSTLSDAFYSLSAGMNALAGPLHGLANQEVLRWIQGVYDKLGGKVPSKEDLKAFVWETLNSGQVIPGYGHAVLRKTDPRYEEQRNFCLKYLPNDEIFQVVSMLYDVVPPILEEQGKAKNPWPNVDAQSGVIQWHYGVTEYDFYTVMFGVGRAMGVLSNLVWDRALGYPIERPKSLTTAMIEAAVGIK